MHTGVQGNSKNFHETLIHTSQHYDKNMSDTLFQELAIPEPDFNLGIGSANHGEQTAKMLMALVPISGESPLK